MGLEDMAQGMDKIARLVDANLSDNFFRHCDLLFLISGLYQHALAYCREELDNISTKEE